MNPVQRTLSGVVAYLNSNKWADTLVVVLALILGFLAAPIVLILMWGVLQLSAHWSDHTRPVAPNHRWRISDRDTAPPDRSLHIGPVDAPGGQLHRGG